jgi:ABC-type uncharacterized transport system fused permease/ATPase subunit
MKPSEIFEKYVKEFVEAPHPNFGGMPICPFAAWARKKGLVKYFDQDLSDIDKIIKIINEMPIDNVYIFVHPIDNFENLIETAFKLETICSKIKVFTGEPGDLYELNGVKTRNEPFPSLIIQNAEFLNKKENSLAKTKYYKKSIDKNINLK